MFFRGIPFVLLLISFLHFSSAKFKTKVLTTDEFQLDCLLIHNSLREKHCSSQIKYSLKLKTLATRRAIFLAQNDGKSFSYVTDSSFGENIYRHRYSGESTKTFCKGIVLKWYKEKSRYDWKSQNGVGVDSRRFAQIVWNSTLRVGCASVASIRETGHVFTVCSYYNSDKFPANSSQNIMSVEKCDQKLSQRVFKYKVLTNGEWLQNCIEEHNRIRKLHSVEPLIIENEIFQSSQKRASEMAQRGFRFFRHEKSEFGENIHWSKESQTNGSHPLSCNASINKWYRELDHYDWDSRLKHNGTVRHFIQIVWKSTQIMGCARVQNIEEPKGGVYTVCLYKPKADFKDPELQWENVFPVYVEPTESPPLLVTNGTQVAERVDELDDETELEKEFKDVDEIIDTRKMLERRTPAPSLEDMFIKTSTEYNGFDRNQYLHKSKRFRQKN